MRESLKGVSKVKNKEVPTDAQKDDLDVLKGVNIDDLKKSFYRRAEGPISFHIFYPEKEGRQKKCNSCLN